MGLCGAYKVAWKNSCYAEKFGIWRNKIQHSSSIQNWLKKKNICWESIDDWCQFYGTVLLCMQNTPKKCKHCQYHNGFKDWVLSHKYLHLNRIRWWSKFSFRISTKIQHQNHDQASAIIGGCQNFPSKTVTIIELLSSSARLRKSLKKMFF